MLSENVWKFVENFSFRNMKTVLKVFRMLSKFSHFSRKFVSYFQTKISENWFEVSSG